MQAHSKALRFNIGEAPWLQWWSTLQGRLLRATKRKRTRQHITDDTPGWFWKTVEGQRVIQAVEAVRWDHDPMGWQSEED
jgi:hypothetical protein